MPEREGNRAFMEKREQKRKRVIALVGLGLFVVFSIAVFWFVGKPMLQFVSQPDQFRDWVDTHGIWGRLAFLGMVMFQVFVAIIPGEPLEIGAGYAFGPVEGTLLCMGGVAIASAIIFLLVKRLGIKLVEVFVSREKINELKFINSEKKLKRTIFVLFFLCLLQHRLRHNPR